VINTEAVAWRVPVAATAKLTVLRYGKNAEGVEHFHPQAGTLDDLDDNEQWFCDIVVRGSEIAELTEHYRP
jgi:hypothetical protein